MWGENAVVATRDELTVEAKTEAAILKKRYEDDVQSKQLTPRVIGVVVVQLEGVRTMRRGVHDADALATTQRVECLDHTQWVRDTAVDAREQGDEQNEVRHLPFLHVGLLDRAVCQEDESPGDEEEDFPWDDGEHVRQNEIQEPDEAILMQACHGAAPLDFGNLILNSWG